MGGNCAGGPQTDRSDPPTTFGIKQKRQSMMKSLLTFASWCLVKPPDALVCSGLVFYDEMQLLGKFLLGSGRARKSPSI